MLYLAKDLIKAAELGNIERLKQVIEENPAWAEKPRKLISIIDKKGRTPLHLTCQHGNTVVARFVVNEIFEATKNCLADVRNEYLNLPDKKGRSALFLAAGHGYDFIVRLLVEKGADTKVATNDTHPAPGSTALTAATENGHVDCFKF